MPTDPDIAAIRQELARVDMLHPTVELAAMVRLGGTWHRRGTDTGAVTVAEVVSTSGAVIRRLVALVEASGLPRPRLAMRAAGGIRANSTWSATMGTATLAVIGVMTPTGAPVPGLAPSPSAADVDAVRGAVMVAASVSSPRRRAHLEFRLPAVSIGRDLRARLEGLGVAMQLDETRARLISKSRGDIVAVLAAIGATRAADAHGSMADRRELRNRATRLANADGANVARSIAAASDQVATIARLVEDKGLAGLPDDLRSVALVRLANPIAPLSELGALCDPPVSKSAVHRRLQRLVRSAKLDGPVAGHEDDPTSM